VLKIADKGECDGRKGPVEMYVCGAPMETGVWKAMMKWQTSRILSRSVESPLYGEGE